MGPHGQRFGAVLDMETGMPGDEGGAVKGAGDKPGDGDRMGRRWNLGWVAGWWALNRA